MKHRCLLGFALIASSVLTATVHAALPDEIILQSTAGAHGMVRGWFTQAEIDASRSRITMLTLDSGALFVQSDRAMIYALDAETGNPLWNSARQVGNPNYPTFRPSFNENLLAIVNGPHVYLLNRYTGDGLWDKDLPGAPVNGPTLSDQRVYVPLAGGQIICHRIKPAVDPLKDLRADKGKKGDSGKGDRPAKAAKPAKADKEAAGDKDAADAKDVPAEKEAAAEKTEAKSPGEGADAATPVATEATVIPDVPRTIARENYKLSQEYARPMVIQSLGPVGARLVVMRQTEDEESVVWPTEQGLVLVCTVDRHQPNMFNIKYRVEMGSAVKTPLVYLPYRGATSDYGLICTTSYNGLVAALDERTGESTWQFATNEPIAHSAAAVGDNIFVLTQLGHLFCLDIKSGKPRWSASHVSQFLAISKDRAYVSDKSAGQIRVLNATNGVAVDSLPMASMPVRLSNDSTDRIYLASQTGLIQSLHEEGLVKPLVYTVPRRKIEKAAKKVVEKVEKPKTDEDKPKKPPAEHKPPVPRKPPPAKADKADQPDKPEKPEKPVPKPRKTRKGKDAGDANPFGAPKQ